MKDSYVTIKIRKTSMRDLKLICALTGVSMMEEVDSLVRGKLLDITGGMNADDTEGLQDKIKTNEKSNT